jgi:hypothetical protein
MSTNPAVGVNAPGCEFDFRNPAPTLKFIRVKETQQTLEMDPISAFRLVNTGRAEYIDRNGNLVDRGGRAL